jgi:DnaJ-class molecular chaperone
MAMTRIIKENTTQRWRTALKRAEREGIEVRQLAGSGMWIATSGTDADVAYEVTPWECECHAGQFVDPICKHRAALLAKLGRLRLEAERPVPDPVHCPACNGMGTVPGTVSSGNTWRYDNVTCDDCHGTGYTLPAAAA